METNRSNIAPWLSVFDGAKAMDFYSKAFGAVELYRLDGDDGSTQVAQLSVNGADFWIQHDPEATSETVSLGKVRMILTVDDPDTMFNQAVAADAEVVFPVSEEYGWRIGRIADPFGYHWEIGKRLD